MREADRPIDQRVSVVIEGQFREGHALDMEDPDGVDGDIDAACLRGDCIGVPRDRLLIEGVDLCCVGGPAG